MAIVSSKSYNIGACKITVTRHFTEKNPNEELLLLLRKPVDRGKKASSPDEQASKSE